MDLEAIARFVDGWPAGQNSPEPWLALQTGAPEPASAAPGQTSARAKQADDHPIENGLCLRLRLPYRKAQILDLRLNGRPVPLSTTDGYAKWTARASTFIQVNIPPKRLRSDDLFIITCQYDPGEKRGHWDTWRSVAG
jgi:hypothetical protein